MKLIRTASEPEVISEFLKGEYHQKEYHADREQHEQVVIAPNFDDARQNSTRRELLFRRHRVTWSELPGDIRWHEVQLESEDVDRIRIFPRGHWPKMVRTGSLTVRNLVGAIRGCEYQASTSEDVTTIQAIAQQIRRRPDPGAVLLIGLDEHSPLTVLEGNHRMIAAGLLSDSKITEFRAFVGLSPNMNECFWYESNRTNFLRHAIRRFAVMQPRIAAVLKTRLAPAFRIF